MALDAPQLIDFANDELRQLGDLLTRLDLRANAAYAEYLARNLGTIINDGGPSNPVLDGSATDGRTICTGGDVYNLMTAVQALQTWFAEPGRRDVIAKWNVNGHKA